MRIKLSNGKDFIVKVQYNTKWYSQTKKDEYNREWYSEWPEFTTEVAIHEWTPNTYDSKVIVKGVAHCSYKDQFSKKIGKQLAYYNAVTAMVNAGLITAEESEEFDLFKLDKAVFDVSKEKAKETKSLTQKKIDKIIEKKRG